MKKIFLSLVFFITLLADANLDDISVYNRDSRVDIMLAFSKPYDALLHQSIEDGKLVFTLDGLSLKTPFTKELDSKLVRQISIVSAKDTTKIVIDTLKKLDIDAVKANDKLSLRLRLLDPAFVKESLKDFTATVKEPAKDFDYTTYALILSVLLAMVILLWVLKYYFKAKIIDKDFKILFQRPLDRQNKFMIIEHKKQHYTMIIGSSNLLLEVSDIEYERKKDNMVYADYSKEESKEFASCFEENKTRLERLAKDIKG